MAEVDAAGSVVKSYGYKPGSTWTTDPLFMKVGGQYYFYQNDHLGTPQKLTAVNGAVVWSAKYSSFGEAGVDISSSITNNLRFAGQYRDTKTGLHYNGWRYYDPKIGRYLRADPIGLRGGINLSAYTHNNPINRIDPIGLEYSKWNITSYDIDYGGPGSWAPPPAGEFGDLGNDYKGWEIHLIVGGGEIYLTCCDGCIKRQHVYKKACIGAAIEASYAEGSATNIDGNSCKNPPERLLGGELGFDLPAPGLGLEGSAVVDMDGGGLSVSGGGGGGIGIGVKSTACYYWLSESKTLGSCSLGE